MQHDDTPTVPIQHWHESDAPAEPGALGSIPTWPPSGERNQRFPESTRPPGGYMSAIVLGISLGANVVLLIGLLGLLLLGRSGFFSPSGSSGQPTQGVSTVGSARSSLTATASPTTPVGSGWLQVVPGSVHVGCGNGQTTQFVVLQNTGPERVQWQANLSGPADQAGVQVAPNHGDLDAGASTPVQIRNTTSSGEAQGNASQQGAVLFEVTSVDAGSPPSLSYTADSCS